MKETEILQIQREQLEEAIAKIEWIADNSSLLTRELIRKTAEENVNYFEKDDSKRRVCNIFRGQYIDQWVDAYVTNQLTK